MDPTRRRRRSCHPPQHHHHRAQPKTSLREDQVRVAPPARAGAAQPPRGEPPARRSCWTGAAAVPSAHAATRWWMRWVRAARQRMRRREVRMARRPVQTSQWRMSEVVDRRIYPKNRPWVVAEARPGCCEQRGCLPTHSSRAGPPPAGSGSSPAHYFLPTLAACRAAQWNPPRRRAAPPGARSREGKRKAFTRQTCRGLAGGQTNPPLQLPLDSTVDSPSIEPGRGTDR